MITNDRQYKITKTQLTKFQEAVDQFDAESIEFKDVHPKLIEAQKYTLLHQMSELEGMIKEYEDLKEGRTLVTEVKSLAELPLAVIKSRIANGLTQAELAKKLELAEQQIQRYESDRYDSVSVKTLIRIAGVLGLRIDADVQLKEVSDSSDYYKVENYPFKQMLQRRWFPNFTGKLNEAMSKSAEMLQSLFDAAGMMNLKTGLNKKSIREGGIFNEFALQAWYARVVIKAKSQALETFFDKNIITEEWLHSLIKLSLADDGPLKATEFLKDAGVRVVIEQHLEGTHLDGAALLIDDVFPVIALTLRHDRLDNFWFVLLHEVGHVCLHLGKEYVAIFDDLDASTLAGIEKEADEFALNAMIANDIWKKSLARFSPSNKTIITQGKKSGVHPAIVAGRIRRETGKYHQFNELIGLGEVRKFFADQLNN